MTKTITFNELRDIKDRLPDGTIHRIAAELGLSVETVRNYFGGENYKEGKSCGVHIESGPNGGIVWEQILYRKCDYGKEIGYLGYSHV